MPLAAFLKRVARFSWTHVRMRLISDDKGAAMPIMVIGLIPAIAAIGSGVDAGRIYMARSQLQAGVDAAALAGARAFAVDDKSANSRTKQAEAYFSENFPEGYLGIQQLQMTPEFKVVSGINQTTIKASGVLPMSFMQLFGVQSRQVEAIAKAELQPRPLEVMVVLDNTGSMKDELPRDANGVVQTRITALKGAAKSFIDILYQGAETRHELAMGFVMYDITVNVGKILTDWRPEAVNQWRGFNGPEMKHYLGTWPANHLGWKGCVMDDATIRDLKSDINIKDSGAWDIGRTLPTEGSHPALDPYFVPPIYIPNIKAGTVTDVDKANPSSKYYSWATGIESGFNLYKLDVPYGLEQANQIANSVPYKKFFYDYYIGLNSLSSPADDDVITKPDGSFYDPAAGGDYNVHYERLPNYSIWKEPTEYTVNKDGGLVKDPNKNKTEVPSPNWQCPQPSVPVAYGRTKSYYDNIIDNENGAIYPANGTLHHSGLLWGYRLLVRSDVFKRENPTNDEAKRALVFMTDGETALGSGGSQNGYYNRNFTWYGRYSDGPISNNIDKLTSQSELRFSKTCQSMKEEENAPNIYIIALGNMTGSTKTMFEKCAPGHVYYTADTASLKAAFDDVAAELVDLHLVQ